MWGSLHGGDGGVYPIRFSTEPASEGLTRRFEKVVDVVCELFGTFTLGSRVGGCMRLSVARGSHQKNSSLSATLASDTTVRVMKVSRHSPGPFVRTWCNLRGKCPGPLHDLFGVGAGR